MTEYRLFEELGQIPQYTSASFIYNESTQPTDGGVDGIRATTSVRDYQSLNQKRSLVKYIAFSSSSSGEQPNVFTSPSQELYSVIASAVSPSRRKIALLREMTTSDKEKKRLVEIWKGDELEAVKDLTTLHGDFYTDGTFSSMSFSSSETSFIYTAEANPLPDQDPADTSDIFSKFHYEPDFGEQFQGKKRPTIFIFHWSTTVTVTPITPPQDILFGQAIFTTDSTIICTGYDIPKSGRRLGPIYCMNRPSSIWSVSIDLSSPSLPPIRLFTDAKRSFRSPRIFKDKKLMVWLSHSATGPHSSCAALHSISPLPITSKSVLKTLVEPVWDPSQANTATATTTATEKEPSFPGIYTESLPNQPFLQVDEKVYLITTSTWRSRSTIIIINLQTGTVRDLTPKVQVPNAPSGSADIWSWTVFGTDGCSKILASRSTPLKPNELVLGVLSLGSNGEEEVSWTVIDTPILSDSTRKALSKFSVSILPIPDRYPVETILIRPKDDDESSSSRPCITLVHGGPHATSTTSFNHSNAAMLLSGYTLSIPNYTGSLGFGQKYVEALLGKCGELDVKDIISSAHHLINLAISQNKKGKQIIQGGSHGGFLSAHLVGQYPEFFSSAIMRNPVISAGEMFSTTDIPDWCLNEFGYSYYDDPTNHERRLTPELYQSMYTSSPIAHLHKVQTPILLLLGSTLPYQVTSDLACIGDVDRRVPPTQGINYGHILKSNGKIVETLMFPGNSHPLDKLEAEKIGWEAARQWMAKYSA